MPSEFCGGFFSTQRSQRISQRCAEKRLPLRKPLHCCSSESSRAARIFFLSPRRRRRERTEERGDSQQSNQARLLSPALSSIRWRRGSVFGCGFAALRPLRLIFRLPCLMALTAAPFAPAHATNSFPVTIHVDAAKPIGPLRPIWRFFGGDEPNYATMKDGQKLMADFGKLRPKDVYCRTHNLLNTGDGTPALKWGSTDAYNEDANGNPIYNWTILDRIFDSYLERGVRPYAQIGFMPQALSTHPEPYRHEWRPGLPYDRIFTGWAYPPKDYSKWGELAYQWTKHCVEHYGKAEVESWYWETWNEANIGYWRGTPQEFQKLHDYAIDGVRHALPTARVGGPDAAGSGGRWTREFLEHCLRGTNFATGKLGTPLDFISFHAKGAPTYTNGHVRMGIANQLRAIQDGFRIVASYPELKNKPIIIGESDPEGCAACQGAQLGYRNSTMYSSYTAASFSREYELADKYGVNFEG